MAAVTIPIGQLETYTSLNAALTAETSHINDEVTFQYTSTLTDTSTQYSNLVYKNITVDFNNFDVTFSSVANNTFLIKQNGTLPEKLKFKGTSTAKHITFTTGGLANVGLGTLDVENLSIRTDGEKAIQCGTNTTITVTGCVFANQTTPETTTSAVAINNASNGVTIDISSTTFSDYYHGIYSTSTSGVDITILNSSITGFNAYGVYCDGGDLSITGSTITSDIHYDISRSCIVYKPYAGDTTTSSISTTTIGCNGLILTAWGDADTTAQGYGGTISGCTIGGDYEFTYGLLVMIGNTTVSSNTFNGSTLYNCHLVMVGNDTGEQLSTAYANNITVSGNTFDLTHLPAADNAGWNYQIIIAKADSCTISGNLVLFQTDPGYAQATQNTNCVYIKGGDGNTVSSNTFVCNWDDVNGIRIDETNDDLTDTLTITGNKLYGTFNKVLIVPDSWLFDLTMTSNTVN